MANWNYAILKQLQCLTAGKKYDYELVCLSDDGWLTSTPWVASYDNSDPQVPVATYWLNNVDVTATHSVVSCDKLDNELIELCRTVTIAWTGYSVDDEVVIYKVYDTTKVPSILLTEIIVNKTTGADITAWVTSAQIVTDSMPCAGNKDYEKISVCRTVTTAWVWGALKDNIEIVKFYDVSVSPAVLSDTIILNKTSVVDITLTTTTADVIANSEPCATNAWVIAEWFQEVDATIAVGWTAQQILPANADRKYFEIQNNSAQDLRISFGWTPSATQGFILYAWGSYNTNGILSTNAISIYWQFTAQEFTYIEIS